METTVKKTSLHWFGHVQYLEDSRRMKQALRWVPDKKTNVDCMSPGEKTSTDIEQMDMTWEDVCLKALDRDI